MTLTLVVLYRNVHAAIPNLDLFKMFLSPSFPTFNKFFRILFTGIYYILISIKMTVTIPTIVFF